MNYSSRFFLYAPLVLFLALAATAMGYWWSVASAIDSKLQATKGHDAVPGVTLNWSKVTISGFPFRIDLTFDDFSVQGRDTQGPFAWKSEHFAVHALTYGALKDVFEAAGGQMLSWQDASGTHAISFLPGAMRASAVRDDRGLARFDLNIIDAGASDFTAGRLQFHMRRNSRDGKTIDLMASADEIKAANGIGFFGPHLRLLQALCRTQPECGFCAAVARPGVCGSERCVLASGRGHLHDEQVGCEILNLTATAPSADTTAKFAALFGPLY